MSREKVECTEKNGNIINGILYPITGLIRIIIFICGLPFGAWRKKDDFSSIRER